MARDERDARRRLLDAGLSLLLQHGYNGIGVQGVLDAAGAPKGSFYHHFADKEDFALQVIDAYMAGVHQALDASLSDTSRPQLARVEAFFDMVLSSYESEGYLGCLLGGLGQELSGVSPVFADKIEWCMAYIAGRLAEALELARVSGDLPSDTDTAALAGLMVNCWEGAALRSRLLRDAAPLQQMLRFALSAATACPPTTVRTPRRR